MSKSADVELTAKVGAAICRLILGLLLDESVLGLLLDESVFQPVAISFPGAASGCTLDGF